MEVAQADDVDADGPHGHQVLERVVERSGRAQPLGEPQVEMVHHRLVAGQRLEDVAVREGHHGLPRRLGRLRRGEEVHRHALHRSRRRVVQREVLDVLLHFFAVGLTNAHAELGVAVLSVPDVPEVGIDFAREEEHVRRRERRDRSVLPPPATSTRFFALTVTRSSFLTPPNSYCCGSPPLSRHVTRGVRAVEKPFSPASYL